MGPADDESRAIASDARRRHLDEDPDSEESASGTESEQEQAEEEEEDEEEDQHGEEESEEMEEDSEMEAGSDTGEESDDQHGEDRRELDERESESEASEQEMGPKMEPESEEEKESEKENDENGEKEENDGKSEQGSNGSGRKKKGKKNGGGGEGRGAKKDSKMENRKTPVEDWWAKMAWVLDIEKVWRILRILQMPMLPILRMIWKVRAVIIVGVAMMVAISAVKEQTTAIKVQISAGVQGAKEIYEGYSIGMQSAQEIYAHLAEELGLGTDEEGTEEEKEGEEAREEGKQNDETGGKTKKAVNRHMSAIMWLGGAAAVAAMTYGGESSGGEKKRKRARRSRSKTTRKPRARRSKSKRYREIAAERAAVPGAAKRGAGKKGKAGKTKSTAVPATLVKLAIEKMGAQKITAADAQTLYEELKALEDLAPLLQHDAKAQWFTLSGAAKGAAATLARTARRKIFARDKDGTELQEQSASVYRRATREAIRLMKSHTQLNRQSLRRDALQRLKETRCDRVVDLPKFIARYEGKYEEAMAAGATKAGMRGSVKQAELWERREHLVKSQLGADVRATLISNKSWDVEKTTIKGCMKILRNVVENEIYIAGRNVPVFSDDDGDGEPGGAGLDPLYQADDDKRLARKKIPCIRHLLHGSCRYTAEKCPYSHSEEMKKQAEEELKRLQEKQCPRGKDCAGHKSGNCFFKHS